MCLKNITMSEICGSVYQPRHQESRDMDSLVGSILTIGLLSPITVRSDDDGYRMICGHRRVNALERILKAGKGPEIPAGNARLDGKDIMITARVHKNISDQDAALHAFVENERKWGTGACPSRNTSGGKWNIPRTAVDR